jgi:MFS transporter, DHA3 family, macrolide efflux protein
MTIQRSAQGMKVFIFVWLGQLVSTTGSGLTSFALGVWIYERTGSVTLFGLVAVLSKLPGMLVSPLAGVYIDRYDRRLMMIGADACAAVSSLVIGLIAMSGSLQLWHICLMTALSSVFDSFQGPAYAAAIPTFVDKSSLNRANGMVQIARAFAQIFSPLIAGVMLKLIHLQGIILADLSTFLVSLIILIIVRFPRIKLEGTSDKKVILGDMVAGYRYLAGFPGLASLALYSTFFNYFVFMAGLLLTPLILGVSPDNAANLGLILTVGGVGMLAGGLTLAAWKDIRQRIMWIIGFSALCGCCLIAIGLEQSILVMLPASFIAYFSLSIIGSCTQAIFQNKVELSIQGRVFALLGMLGNLTALLAYLSAGQLADNVFRKLLAPGGLLVERLGVFIDVKHGGGNALLFMALGFLTICLTLISYAYPHFRHVEAAPQPDPKELTAYGASLSGSQATDAGAE